MKLTQFRDVRIRGSSEVTLEYEYVRRLANQRHQKQGVTRSVIPAIQAVSMKQNMRSIAGDVVTALAAGVVVAIAVFPVSVIAFVVFLATAMMKTRSRFRREQTDVAFGGAAVIVLVFCGVIAAAALYTPAKTVGQQLQREVRLPSKSLTLAEISYLSVSHRDSLPIRTSFCFAEADKDLRVEWPQERLTLGTFLAAIEAQTNLRHRFMHCGNGYAVLSGGDCSLGLYVFDPELAVPFPRERFNLEDYAAVRIGVLPRLPVGEDETE